MSSLFCASIHAKIRDETDSHSASEDYWLRCLYEGEEGNPADVEKGFLKSELLVRVRVSTTTPIPKLLTAHYIDVQTYVHITILSRGWL